MEVMPSELLDEVELNHYEQLARLQAMVRRKALARAASRLYLDATRLPPAR